MTLPGTIDWQALRESLAAHMARAGLSQKKLAKASGVYGASLSEFLSGKKKGLSADALAGLAAALEITVGELLGEAAALPGVGAEIAGLTWRQLTESTRNPRKSVDDEALIELASSIAEAGVLQNLVVGRAGADGVHPIVAGARRWRAVRFLAQQGDRIAGVLAENYRIPCRVIADDDTVALMTLAVTENLQREDLSPMEEAEAFAWLRTEAKWTTAEIAGRISRSQRFVQRRLALVDKLDDSVKAALRAGKINFVQAEAVTLAPKEDQQDLVDDIVQYGEYAEDVREQLLGEKHAVKDAFFDPALYDGEILDGDPDDPDDRYFADTPQFARLQRAAAIEKVLGLKEEWAWAELRVAGDDKVHAFQIYQCGKSKDRKKAGAVVTIDFNGRVKIDTGLVAPATHAAPPRTTGGGIDSAAQAAPKRHFTDKHLCLARRIKTTVLQDAVLADHGAALRLCVLGLLGADEVRVQQSQGDSNGNGAYGPATIVESRERFLDLGGKIKKHEKNEFGGRPRLTAAPVGTGYYGALDPVETWVQLRAMSDADVLSYLATIVAAQTGTWNSFRGELGDSPLAARIAADLGVDMVPIAAAQLRDEAYLKSAGKQHLAEIAADLRCQVKDSHTGKQLRGFIEDALLLADEIGYVPRELRWGGDAFLPDELAERDREEAEIAAEEQEMEIYYQETFGDDEDDAAIDTLAGDEDLGEDKDAPALQAAPDDRPEIPASLRRV